MTGDQEVRGTTILQVTVDEDPQDADCSVFQARVVAGLSDEAWHTAIGAVLLAALQDRPGLQRVGLTGSARVAALQRTSAALRDFVEESYCAALELLQDQEAVERDEAAPN